MRRWLALALVLFACKSPEEPTELGALSGCDPTDPVRCVLPWPSGYFQVADDTLPSGVRNAFGPDSLPVNRDAVKFTPDQLNEKDGFATLTPLVVGFENLDVTTLIGHQDLDRYSAADATTVIVNAETGERVPHFAEMDHSAPIEQRLLILRPVTPMAPGTRHVVGIRGLKHADGSNVIPSPAFKGLRDNDDEADPDVPRMRDRYETGIFDVLAADGFNRSELQLAWDFTTGSQAHNLKDITHIRDDAMSRMPTDGPGFEIDTVEISENDCTDPGETIHKTIEGRVFVPRYTDLDTSGAIFVRGDDQLPVYQEDTDPNFILRIPCSVYADPSAATMILQYGHGLLGDRGEARTSWLSEYANREGFIVFAMDWTGMSTVDATPIALMIASDISGFRMVPERSQQGLIEFVYGLRMMQSTIVDHEELAYDGTAILDSLPIGYLGNSQGGILGAAYVALSPDLERGVVGVPGMPYSLLMNRSTNFEPFMLLFKSKFTDARDITLILGIMQTLWDPGEPSGFAHALNQTPLPGNVAKAVLIQAGRGDAQVSTLGAHIMARAFGAAGVTPMARPIWGVEEQAPGFRGSAIVEIDFTDVDPEPIESVPPNEATNTHECPRRYLPAQEQARDFMLDAVVNHYCDGPCVTLREGLCD
jgi:pimeloyl-ACP methyl ester carboxylesterase